MRPFPRVFSAGWRHLSFTPHGSRLASAGAPLAGLGSRTENLDIVMFLSGIAVLSAGLVVMRAARLPTVAPSAMHAARPEPPRAAVARRLYTAEEALAERAIRAGDRELLLDALAQAAGTFYSIAGHLQGEASERVVRKADDLRELVWLNRAGRAP